MPFVDTNGLEVIEREPFDQNRAGCGALGLSVSRFRVVSFGQGWFAHAGVNYES